MRKSILLLSSLALLFAGAGMLFRQDARRETYLEIQRDMTKTEVRHLLGGPLATPDRTRTLVWGGTEELWMGRDGTILVVFNQKGALTYKEWIEPEDMIYIDDIVDCGRR